MSLDGAAIANIMESEAVQFCPASIRRILKRLERTKGVVSVSIGPEREGAYDMNGFSGIFTVGKRTISIRAGDGNAYSAITVPVISPWMMFTSALTENGFNPATDDTFSYTATDQDLERFQMALSQSGYHKPTSGWKGSVTFKVKDGHIKMRVKGNMGDWTGVKASIKVADVRDEIDAVWGRPWTEDVTAMAS